MEQPWSFGPPWNRRSATVIVVTWLLVLLGFNPLIAQESKTFRFGADREGGGPYLLPDPNDVDHLIGFEVDLADAVASQLGRSRAEFVQCQWDQILAVLGRGDIDVALNGYEFTPERASRYLATIPYYIYELGLCARSDNPQIVDWDSLKTLPSSGNRYRIGVLEGSAADNFISTELAESCTPVRLSGSVEALLEVVSGQLDATVQDTPMLHYYVDHLKRHPELALKGQPRAEGYYVMYLRAQDDRVCQAINTAIQELYRSGELQAIYERYGIWNTTQEKLTKTWEGWRSGLLLSHRMTLKDLIPFVPKLLHSAGLTVLLSLLAMPLAIAIGLGVAMGRSWWTPTLGGEHEGIIGHLVSRLLALYVEVVRGTPLAFQLFVIYFVLPEFGLRINEFWAGVIALAINYSAYESEIFRLGLQAIPKGQLEAALSLGMSRPLAVRRIILPQAVRMVIPATANDFIALFKDTAVCSVIAVEELSKQYSIVAKTTGLFLETAALTALLYLLMSFPLSLLSNFVERKLKRSV